MNAVVFINLVFSFTSKYSINLFISFRLNCLPVELFALKYLSCSITDCKIVLTKVCRGLHCVTQLCKKLILKAEKRALHYIAVATTLQLAGFCVGYIDSRRLNAALVRTTAVALRPVCVFQLSSSLRFAQK